MTDFLGYGKDKRREGNLEILAGRVTFRCVSMGKYSASELMYCHREAFQEMLDSVSKNGHTFEECKQVLKDSAFVRQTRVSAYIRAPALRTRRHQARFWLQRVLPILQVTRHPRCHCVEVGRSGYRHAISSNADLVSCLSGMEPLIRAILTNLLGDDANHIDIISNSVQVHKDGSWYIKYRHPTRYCTRPFPQLAYPVLDLLSPQCIWA